jgi:chromosome segregation protein
LGCREGLKQLEEKMKNFLETIKEQEVKLHRKEIQVAEEKTALSSIQESFWNQYQLTIEEIKEELGTIIGQIQALPMDRKERRVRELRRDIENAGDVNLGAVEEFERHREREEFLRQQLDDLQRSKNELIQIINKLDEDSRKLFEDSFALIRRNFQKNFNLLFEGGEADLTFTESKDLLEAGIEITAKPPGKQMRSITLLSGGEKCLTAMALLFAIFEVRPSAFCLLDEVDAPLDEANVIRFTNMIRQFVDKTQFIIITHNKRTMSIADVLFGVSMEEKGVSKLLSLTFDNKQNQPPEPVLLTAN